MQDFQDEITRLENTHEGEQAMQEVCSKATQTPRVVEEQQLACLQFSKNRGIKGRSCHQLSSVRKLSGADQNGATHKPGTRASVHKCKKKRSQQQEEQTKCPGQSNQTSCKVNAWMKVWMMFLIWSFRGSLSNRLSATQGADLDRRRTEVEQTEGVP